MTTANPVDVAHLQHAVEAFLYREASLLDQWRLDEWADLLADDARYVVPPTDDPHADTYNVLALIDDDATRARARARRLLSDRAHREYPFTRTRRLITNVVITGAGDDGLLDVEANFVVYRIRHEESLAFIGHYRYRLRPDPSGDFRIVLRRAELDLDALRPHGTISIIV